jgi:signal transduction histidine kinase
LGKFTDQLALWTEIAHNGKMMSKNRPFLQRLFAFRHGLTGRFLFSLGALVIAGSVALLVVLQRIERLQEVRQFSQQAKTNAEFLSTMALPLSPVLAQHLETLTGWQVYFSQPAGDWQGSKDSIPQMELPNVGVVDRSPEGQLRVRWNVARNNGGNGEVLFLKSPERWQETIFRPGIVAALGTFLVVALAIGYGLARSLIRPLRSFAAALPQINAEEPPPLETANRADELGEVARTFLQTRQQFLQERDKRMQAERLATLGRMAASLAHEVRNPVAAIRLHAELIADDEPPPPIETQRSLEHILRESDHIESLVQQWTFFARPEPPRRQPTDLSSLIRNACAKLQPAADRARVSFQLLLPDKEVIFQADAIRLHSAILNVLQNAVHASPEGRHIEVQLRSLDAHLELSIKDQGPGFSAEGLARSHEPFYSEKEGGMGLGLTVAEELCRAHGGTLTFQNAPAGGAIVKLTFPREQSISQIS